METLSDLREIRVSKRRSAEHPWKVTIVGKVGQQTLRQQGTGTDVEAAKKLATGRYKGYKKLMQGRLGINERETDTEDTETT